MLLSPLFISVVSSVRAKAAASCRTFEQCPAWNQCSPFYGCCAAAVISMQSAVWTEEIPKCPRFRRKVSGAPDQWCLLIIPSLGILLLGTRDSEEQAQQFSFLPFTTAQSKVLTTSASSQTPGVHCLSLSLVFRARSKSLAFLLLIKVLKGNKETESSGSEEWELGKNQISQEVSFSELQFF